MRVYKLFVVVLSVAVVLYVKPALSEEKQQVLATPPVLYGEELKIPERPFFKINRDLRRIGLDEIRNIANFKFEATGYKLDPDFRFGYGDIVSVNLWGKIEASHRLTIDRDGNIIIPLIGKVNIVGLTIDEGRAAVKKELDKKYTNVELELSVLDVQNIQIVVLGNVVKPGPYVVSPFCRIVEAVAKAGGPNEEGSLIDIRLIKDGKQTTSFNAYDYIFKADQSKNLKLSHGDIIYIPERKNIVAIRGEVRYPGIYEVGDMTLLSKAIDGPVALLPTKFKRKTLILRTNPETGATELFKEIVFEPSQGIASKDDIALENHDIVIVTTVLDYTPSPVVIFKTVHLYGEVKIPSDYLIKEGETLGSLLKRAGGLKGTAFIQGAIFTRDFVKKTQISILDELLKTQEKRILEEEAQLAEAILTQGSKEAKQRVLKSKRKALKLMASRLPEGRIIIDFESVIKGDSDIILEERDNIYIPPIPDWVLVTGAVYNPASVAFRDGKPLEYYINMTGGAIKFADKEGIYIIKSDGRTESKITGYSKICRGDIIVVPEMIE